MDGVCSSRTVEGVPRANHSSSIWTTSRPLVHASEPMFVVEGRIGGIKHNLSPTHVYHMGTGKCSCPSKRLSLLVATGIASQMCVKASTISDTAVWT